MATIFFAMSGKIPSRVKEAISAGERIPAADSICAICVPAFTYTMVPASMPSWLTQ